jgi:hypothetical protein
MARFPIAPHSKTLSPLAMSAPHRHRERLRAHYVWAGPHVNLGAPAQLLHVLLFPQKLPHQQALSVLFPHAAD